MVMIKGNINQSYFSITFRQYQPERSKINNDKYKLGTFYKFPFHLYKLENWDVEHINSFTYNEENDMETQKEWTD